MKILYNTCIIITNIVLCINGETIEM